MTINICDFLKNSAKTFPHKVAFTQNDKSITYKDFDELSNKIASEILKHELGAYTQIPVLILLPKSIECLSAMFGVLKSGNFYTIADENSPKERLLKIIQVLKPQILITSKKYDFAYLNLKTIFSEDFDKFDTNQNNLKTHIDTNLAYVLFTSGSTGLPKGVSISHKSVIDYTDWVSKTFKVSHDEILLSQAPFYFDNSVLDIFTSVKNAATLHIVASSNYSFPVKILEYLQNNDISMIFWVPSVLVNIANANVLQKFPLKSLKKVLFAGEVMPNKQLNIWRKHLAHAMFANLYGPTEITVDCSYYICDREFDDDEELPIGTACENMQLYVFDENSNLITKDMPNKKGELCVRGTGLSVGYFNDKEKTQNAFIQNPLHDNYSDKIYKTGDIVCYNDKGELIYKGRKDFQIKHMGYRIELGEIETAILAIKGIDNACVLYNDENKNIVLIYESKDKITQKELLLSLRDKLPKYMLPTKFICLDQMPLNINGKIDRKKLKEII
ncbi:MAG: amino acid adenylation domain-containing protein [Campylobacter sp.]|nr:amino acid adenylation domain-containing protein [Campylobacter sp.]